MPVAGSRVGVIGISKKLPLVFRVSIVKTIERRVRWTGKKIILSRHRTCEPALAEQSNFSRRNLIQVCLKKNGSSMVKQTKLFALPKFGSLRGSTSASLKIGENLAIRKKLASFWNWGSHLFYVTWWQIYYLCKQNWLKFALVRLGPNPKQRHSSHKLRQIKVWLKINWDNMYLNFSNLLSQCNPCNWLTSKYRQFLG